MKTILKTVAGNPENQDRGAIIDAAVGQILVVADGAGGLSGAAKAAEMAVEFVRRNAHELRESGSCASLLQKMDESIAGDQGAGETTCALAVVAGNEIYGASVGDSGIWMIGETGFVDLTKGQLRKPFIGSGGAWPIPFAHQQERAGHLLLATDGLLKYTSSDRIAAICRGHDLAEAARRLIELVRYPSGALPDDITLILATF